MIYSNKIYKTRDGKSVRILATDLDDSDGGLYPVAAYIKDFGVFRVSKMGMFQPDVLSILDLIEYNPAQDYVLDQPILVSNDKKVWARRHFAKFKDGKVYVWKGKNSSWMLNDPLMFDDIGLVALAEVWNYTMTKDEFHTATNLVE